MLVRVTEQNALLIILQGYVMVKGMQVERLLFDWWTQALVAVRALFLVFEFKWTNRHGVKSLFPLRLKGSEIYVYLTLR